MTSSEERHEAAESLKRYAHDQLQGGLLNTLKLATGVDGNGTWRDVLLSLADLIEPGDEPNGELPERLRTFADNDERSGCDRDALLALAGEIDSMERIASVNEVRVSDEMLAFIARRIREALGVQDGD